MGGIQYLTNLQPAFDALVNVIPVLARTHQQSRADAMSGKRKELSTRLAEKKALQVELVTAKFKGEIAQDDFDVLKASLSADIAEIETALCVLSTDADSLPNSRQTLRDKTYLHLLCGPAFN